MIRLLSRLFTFELCGHKSLYDLAIERRSAKVADAYRQITEAHREFRATMREGRETMDFDWRTL